MNIVGGEQAPYQETAGYLAKGCAYATIAALAVAALGGAVSYELAGIDAFQQALGPFGEAGKIASAAGGATVGSLVGLATRIPTAT